MEISETLNKLLKPVWIRIGGYWYPRGGIPNRYFLAKQRAAKKKLGYRLKKLLHIEAEVKKSLIYIV